MLMEREKSAISPTCRVIEQARTRTHTHTGTQSATSCSLPWGPSPLTMTMSWWEELQKQLLRVAT